MVLVSHFYRQQAEIGSWPLEFLTPVDFVSSILSFAVGSCLAGALKLIYS